MDQFFVTSLLALPLIGAYAINAIGIVVVYRASKVLNLAHGAITMFAAFAAFQLVQWGLPRYVGLVGGVVASAAIALIVERVFVRRLRSGGATAQTIGTVAAFGVLVTLAASIWGTTPRAAVQVFPQEFFKVSSTTLTYGQIGLFLSMLVIAGVLYVVLQRTYLGLVLRGTAENRLAASLMGADPDRMTQLAWVIGGVMAGLAGEMLGAVGSIHPYQLAFAALPAYIAALIGGMQGLPGAVAGAAIVGLVQSWVGLVGPLEAVEGNAQLIIALLALAVMAARGARITGASDEGAALESRVRVGSREPFPRWKLAMIGISILAVAWIPHQVSFSLLGNLNQAAIFAIVAISLVLLTGWVGQISLAHATFVGIGAFTTGILANNLAIPFPVNLPLAAVAAGAAAAILGAVALRVRGLYLAVATLIFAWMGEQFLFRQSWMTSQASVFPEPLGRNPGFPTIDLTDRVVFFYVAWAAVMIVLFVAANLRDTKTGRAFFAVKGSEMAATSLGIDVVRYKLMAFVASGGIAGLAGGLVMLQQRTVGADQFGITTGLFYLAILVVGGVQSLGGAIAAALLFGLIQEMFFRVEALAEYVQLVSALLLAVVLVAYRQGLAGIPDSFASARERLVGRFPFITPMSERLRAAADAFSRWIGSVSARLARPFRRIGAASGGLWRRLVKPPVDAEPVDAIVEADAKPARTRLPKRREKRQPLLQAEGITVRFGGLTAANGVNVNVYEGEIVGLIGPNGAGKTTTFNAIAGLNEPTEGTVSLFGEDVTAMPVHKRAALGVGRTFQLIQLFPQLTVFENLLVATHLENPSGVFSGAIAGSKCLLSEAEARRRTREVIGSLGLDDVAERRVAGLPFGVLRMVEVGRSMVTRPRLIMLDEPASGLDNSETDRLSELLLNVRDMGVGLLLIEHDVRMVTSVSDYMYVIDQGTPLADGTPAKVQRDPKVIAAYLGSGDEHQGPSNGAASEGRRSRKAPHGRERVSA